VLPRCRSLPVYRRVIVPLDGSPFAEAILPFLRQIAGPLDMEVILLRVVPPPPLAPLEEPQRVFIRELETRHIDAEEYLASLAVDLRNRGVRVDTRVRRGQTAEEILAVTRETAADLIAMCTHDRSGFGRFVFGSVAEAVARRAGIPVLLLKPGETEPRQVVNDSDADERRRPAGGRPVAEPTHREENVILVRALMTGAPITLPPDISIFEARRLMDGERIRHVLVTLGGDLLGIVTDRDIRLNMPSQATSLSVWELNYLLAKLTVGEVMTGSVITIGPDQDAHDAAQIMLDHKIGALPVIDDGRLVGVVTETDLLRAFVKSGVESATLRAR
jgi:acetoin utilization protein AcuB